jgi:hypothetical protein
MKFEQEELCYSSTYSSIVLNVTIIPAKKVLVCLTAPNKNIILTNLRNRKFVI